MPLVVGVSAYCVLAGVLLWYVSVQVRNHAKQDDMSETDTLSSAEVAQSIAKRCAHLAEKETAQGECVAHAFAQVSERRGIAFIGELLMAFQRIDAGYEQYDACHVLAHEIMAEIVSRAPDRWKEILSQMNEGELDPARCGSGFMHGVLEAHQSVDPDFKIDATLFEELCHGTLVQEAGNCVHILGHLALVEANGWLDGALKKCDGLSGGLLFQCYGGIFMEDSMRTNLHVHGILPLPIKTMAWFDEQVARCRRLGDTGVMVSACWYDLPEVFAQTHMYDLAKTYAFCDTAPNTDARDRCYIRGSYLIALVPDMPTVVFSPKGLCVAYAPGSMELSGCMQGVVHALLSSSMNFLGRTVAFCSARTGTAVDECFQLILGEITNTAGTPKERHMLCDALPETYRARCVELPLRVQ